MLENNTWDQGSFLKDRDRREALQFTWKWGFSSINLENKRIMLLPFSFSPFPNSSQSLSLPFLFIPFSCSITQRESKPSDTELSSVAVSLVIRRMLSREFMNLFAVYGGSCARQRLAGWDIGRSPLFWSLPNPHKQTSGLSAASVRKKIQ